MSFAALAAFCDTDDLSVDAMANQIVAERRAEEKAQRAALKAQKAEEEAVENAREFERTIERAEREKRGETTGPELVQTTDRGIGDAASHLKALVGFGSVPDSTEGNGLQFIQYYVDRYPETWVKILTDLAALIYRPGDKDADGRPGLKGFPSPRTIRSVLAADTVFMEFVHSRGIEASKAELIKMIQVRTCLPSEARGKWILVPIMFRGEEIKMRAYLWHQTAKGKRRELIKVMIPMFIETKMSDLKFRRFCVPDDEPAPIFHDEPEEPLNTAADELLNDLSPELIQDAFPANTNNWADEPTPSESKKKEKVSWW